MKIEPSQRHTTTGQEDIFPDPSPAILSPHYPLSPSRDESPPKTPPSPPPKQTHKNTSSGPPQTTTPSSASSSASSSSSSGHQPTSYYFPQSQVLENDYIRSDPRTHKRLTDRGQFRVIDILSFNERERALSLPTSEFLPLVNPNNFDDDPSDNNNDNNQLLSAFDQQKTASSFPTPSLLQQPHSDNFESNLNSNPSSSGSFTTSGSVTQQDPKLIKQSEQPFGSTSATRTATCFLVKERKVMKGRKTTTTLYRNVVLAIDMNGITLLQPFTETVISQHPYREIKLWKHTPTFFHFLWYPTPKGAGIPLLFETRVGDEIMKVIHECVEKILLRRKQGLA